MQRHHEAMARAAGAAMQQNFAETLEITSEALVSGIYEDMQAEEGRRGKAEARLMMATAMHYTENPYDDIVRVLGYAMDSPDDVKKDVQFTLAVVHLSFDNTTQAQAQMLDCLETIARLKAAKYKDLEGAMGAQEAEAKEFLEQLPKDGQVN